MEQSQEVDTNITDEPRPVSTSLSLPSGYVYPERGGQPFSQQIPLIPGELWYAYAQRLSVALGYVHFRRFIEDYVKPLGEENWRRFQLPSYDCNSAGLDFGFRLPDDELFLRTSLYPGLAPLMSRGAQARYVNGFWNLRHGRDAMGVKAKSFMLQLCRCPECWKESIEEYGSPTYFRDHNMPGVTVCWKHGCTLERFVGERGRELTQDCFEIMEVLPKAIEYATFCHDLLSEGIQCCLQDVIGAVKTRLQLEFGIESRIQCSTLSYDKDFDEYGRIMPDVAKSVYKGFFHHPDFSSFIAFLLFLFGNVKEMEKEISTCSAISAFSKEVGKGTIGMLSEYRDSFVRVRCGKCGHEFGTTPHSIVTGLGCPNCRKNLSEVQLLSRRFAKVGEGYKCLDIIRSSDQRVRIEETASGKVLAMRLSHFIDFGSYTTDGYVPFSRTSIENANNTDKSIQTEISGFGAFILEKHETIGSVHKLGIRHVDCNRRFDITLQNFRRLPLCRICQKKGMTTDSFADEIRTLSNGAFRLVGEYGSRVTVEICTGTFRMTGYPSRIRERIWEYMKNPDSLGKKLDRTCENSSIRAFIDDRRNGDFFRNEDFHGIADSSVVRLRLAYLATKGILKPVYQGVWCRSSVNLTPEQAVEAMWIRPKGKRVGFLIGNALLQDLGIDTQSHEGGLVSRVIGDKNHPRHVTVCGRNYKVRGCKTDVTEDNWPVLAVFYTIRFKNEIAEEVPISSVKIAFARWILECGKGYEDFLPYENLFSGKSKMASVEVMAFARALESWANTKEES